MIRHFSLIIVFIISFSCSTPDESLTNDELNWLEQVEGTKAIHWVKKENSKTEKILQTFPKYKKFKETALKIYESKDKIPYGRIEGTDVYNLWKDEKNRRGILRRTKLGQYQQRKIKWETVLNIDLLAKDEKKNWIYKKMKSLSDSSYALISLSDGGKDATVIREFDLRKKKFKKGGFSLPEAKTEVSWLTKDELLVGTDYGKGSLTESGYPRLIKRWKRGTDISKAKLVFEGKKEDVLAYSVRLTTGKKEGPYLIGRMKTFFKSEFILMNENDSAFTLPIPESAELKGIWEKQSKLVVSLKDEWSVSGKTFQTGAVLLIDPFGLKEGVDKNDIELVFQPSGSMSVKDIGIGESHIWITVLENVQGSLLKFSKHGKKWMKEKIALPSPGNVSLISSHEKNENIFVSYEDFLTPTTLYQINSKKIKKIKALPSRFDGSKFVASQSWAISKDGTKVPYFIVRSKKVLKNKKNPTLLYGYGGFEVSLTPRYQQIRGNLWLKEGGVYVLANIRGGGEFGPHWHQAALKENRWRAFEDFIAVAEDLIEKGWTSPKNLGIQGGSNGGLLVGTVAIARPDLFNAVLCQVPLLDMIRYVDLPPGASWVGEYGDPRKPKMRDYILSYSPYQNVSKDGSYPKIFFRTSTKDDRVHPAHARKMAAKMLKMNHQVLYYENIEGGHGGSANYVQYAKHAAMDYSYLLMQLR